MTLPPSEESPPEYEPRPGSTASNISSPTIPEINQSFSWAKAPKPTLSSRLAHRFRRNPGFCPGAFNFRRASLRSRSKHLPVKLHEQVRHLDRCHYCGLVNSKIYPRSYIQDWPSYAKLSAEFFFESHVPATRLDHTDRRSCLLCWEDKRIWVEPMNLEVWGAHMRKHFKEDGYQICGNRTQLMQARSKCPAKKVRWPTQILW